MSRRWQHCALEGGEFPVVFLSAHNLPQWCGLNSFVKNKRFVYYKAMQLQYPGDSAFLR